MTGDKDLTVKITTTGDDSGAKDVDKSLQQVAASIKTGTKHTEEQIKTETRSGASKRELREILHGLAEQFPIVGDIGRVAMLGVVGAIMLVVKAVGAALESIRELGNRSTPEFATLTHAIENSKKAMEDFDLATRESDRALRNLLTSNESVQSASAAYLAQLKQRSDGQNSINEKSQARDIALLEAAEEAGLITHEQFIAKKLRLDEDYARRRMKLEDEVANATLSAKHLERANTYIEAGELARRIAAKREEAKQSAGQESFSGDKLEKDKKDLDSVLDKIKELQKEELEMQGFHPFESEFVLLQKQKINKSEQEDQSAIADRLRRQIKADQDRNFNARDTAGSDRGELSELEARLRKDYERLHQLDQELPRDTQNAKAASAQRKQEGSIESQTRQFKAEGELSKEFGSAVMSDQSSVAMRELLQGIIRNNQRTISVIQGAHGNIKEQAEQIQTLNDENQRLKREITGLSAQMRTSNLNHT